MRSNGPVCGPASRTGSRCWRGRAWGVLGTFRVTVTIHKSWGRGQGGRGRDTPEFGVEWGVLYGQLHDAAALRRRACQNLQVFQVKPRKPKGAPRQRVRFTRCACVTVTIIIPKRSQWNKVPLISAPESLGQGNGGYHTEKRAMKLIGRVAGESVGWSGRQLIVNDICRGLRVPHTSALTHTKTHTTCKTVRGQEQKAKENAGQPGYTSNLKWIPWMQDRYQRHARVFYTSA